MSREIKFRAWKRSARTMLPVGEVIFFNNGTFIVNGEDPDCELMQFTGISDKNGVEIYEGDVVELTDGNYRIRQFDVRYDENRAMFVQRTNKFPHSTSALPRVHSRFYEVIGNVYESPELMEAQR